jgi:folate-binding protein YgfZ
MTSELVWADSERDVIHVRGADAQTFLHSQLAQNISGLVIGDSAHSLLLEPTGHVHSLVRVLHHGSDFFTLDVDRGFGESVIARLRRFILRSKVEMTSSDWVVRSIRGSGARESIGATGGVAIVGWGDTDAVDVVASPIDAPQIGQATEPPHIDMFRVDARWPRLGIDVLVGDIPATTGVVFMAVSFTKGCYPGQELVERMDSRGADAPVNLRVVSRDGVGVGSRVELSPQDTGTITSVGFSRAFVRVGRGSQIGESLGRLD